MVVYNYNFELAAIIVMGVILLYCLMSLRFPLMSTRTFELFLLIALAKSVCTVLSGYCSEHTGSGFLAANEVLGTLKFLLESINCYLFYMYALQLCNRDIKWRMRMYRIGIWPTALMFVITLLNPITKWLFYFDENDQYVSGVLGALGFLFVYIYVLAEILLMILNKKRMLKRSREIIVFYGVMMTCALFIQYFNRELILNGMAKAIVLLVVFVTMQNPGELLDSTTGKFNNVAFKQLVNERIVQGREFFLIALHLSKFININSVLGCRKGDRILELVAGYLAELEHGVQVFRIEPHTFAVMAVGNEKKAQEFVERIKGRFEEKWLVDGMELTLEANTIMACYPEHFTKESELDALREYMMECAKQLGPSASLAANEEITSAYRRQLGVENAINKAIRQKSVQVYYQPIYSMVDEKLVAAEALARLCDEELGNISPAEFIPIAEKNGSIVELGEQIFEKCCDFIAGELMPHPELGIRTIHINLSVVQCIQRDMADRLIRILEKYHIPQGMINLELTERITLETTDLMREHMEKLTSHGVRFSLDDYGTGSSNAAYLIDYSFKMVKFDKKMMDSYFENPAANMILGNEFRTLQNLGIDIVAEGIETSRQVEALGKADMDYVQGYYFAKPSPPEQFIELVKERAQSA